MFRFCSKESIYKGKYVITCFIIISFCIFLGCGGNGTGSDANTVILTGFLGDGYQVKNSAKELYPLEYHTTNEEEPIVVNQIWALPITQKLGWWTLENKKIITIQENGTFQITLSITDDSDWILLLLNTNAPEKRDQLIGYVALKEVEESLINIPIPEANSDIELGEINQNGDDALSENTIDDVAEDFSLSAEELKEMAKTDDLFKLIKNVYMNFNEETGISYGTETQFIWEDLLNNLKNAYANPLNYWYKSYRIIITTNDMEIFQLPELANRQYLASLYPPSEIHHIFSDKVSDPENPISNDEVDGILYLGDNMACGDDDFWAFGDENSIGFYLPRIGVDNEQVAAGDWILKKEFPDDPTQNIEVARFDFAPASPLYDDKNPRAYMPSPRIVVDQNNVIQRVDLKWYLFDTSNDEFKEITNLIILNKMLRKTPRITMHDYRDRGPDGVTWTQESHSSYTGVSEFDHVWVFTPSDDTSIAVLQGFSVEYWIGNHWISVGWFGNY